MGKVRSNPQPRIQANAPAKALRRYKGRRVYTLEDLSAPAFNLGLPPEPEWEKEWKRRNPNSRET